MIISRCYCCWASSSLKLAFSFTIWPSSWTFCIDFDELVPFSGSERGVDQLLARSTQDSTAEGLICKYPAALKSRTIIIIFHRGKGQPTGTGDPPCSACARTIAASYGGRANSVFPTVCGCLGRCVRHPVVHLSYTIGRQGPPGWTSPRGPPASSASY